MKLKFTLSFTLFILLQVGFAQTYTYDMLIKGGTVIDPKNNINATRDIAVKDGKIAAVAPSLAGASARQVVDAKGLIVTPGLIDIHGHVFWGTNADRYLSDGNSALPPDGFTFRNGVTTIVDCGGAGWKNFALFKKNVIDVSKTRVLSFLNIVGEGMRGGKYEQDIEDMNPAKAAEMALANKEYIVGFKLAHFSGFTWVPTERVVEAGKLANIPVIIDFGGSRPTLSIEELYMKKLRPGDIYTHAYASLDGSRETIVDEKTNQLKPFVLAAQKRGIIFDVGYGGASFNYTQAIPALKAGLYPNTISTDLHTGSMNTSMKGQLDVMSKFLQMGMSLPDVINASSWAAAQVIKKSDLGNLSVGAPADIAILHLRKGNFGFYDKTGYKVTGDKRFECEMTIKGGNIVFDMNGIATPIYAK
ncbi:MAG: amidohydrolase/deacetylase family metallohydrolase [Sphingobacteriales bacterium]|jgi:dihydroorotase